MWRGKRERWEGYIEIEGERGRDQVLKSDAEAALRTYIQPKSTWSLVLLFVH